MLILVSVDAQLSYILIKEVICVNYLSVCKIGCRNAKQKSTNKGDITTITFKKIQNIQGC